MDHIYAVLREFRNSYRGNASILEFGTSDGYAFTKMLYATNYLGLTDRVAVRVTEIRVKSCARASRHTGPVPIDYR